MPRLAERQGRFAAALLDPGAPIPGGLAASGGWSVARRFAVYRNNVLAGLGAALATRFPAVQRLVGAEFFRAMARDFVRAFPPRSPLLLDFGVDFPDFIETFAPAADVPYLADVARLESAWWTAYHAAEAEPLGAAALAACDPLELLAASAELHPAMRLVSSPWPIVSIWAANIQDAEAGPIESWQGEDALITRPQAEVEVRRLPPGGHVFLSELARGATFAAAGEAALAAAADFDLARNVAGLVEAGVLAGTGARGREAAP